MTDWKMLFNVFYFRVGMNWQEDEDKPYPVISSDQNHLLTPPGVSFRCCFEEMVITNLKSILNLPP